MKQRWMGTFNETPQSNGELFDQCPHKDESTGADHHKLDNDGFCIFCGNKFPKDICRNRHRGNAESQEVFQSIKDRLTEQQNRVFKVIRDTGGATTDEIALVLGLTPNEVSPRISELHFKLHKIEKIGTRPTRRNHPAAVWKAV